MRIPLHHYSGCGNSFYLIDNRLSQYTQLFPDITPQLCRSEEIPTVDGIILLENDSSADFGMRIYNSDGSEAEMCGNGLRCFIRFLYDLDLSSQECTIATAAGLYTGHCTGENVSVTLPPPLETRWNLRVSLENSEITVHYLDTGVPHAVCFFEEIASIDLTRFAQPLRSHSLWGDRGANVDVAAIDPEGVVHLRTFERGVEGETLACGTGAIATALAAERLYGLPSPIRIQPKSQELLQITTQPHLKMEGPATRLAHYAIEVDEKKPMRYNIPID